MIGTVAATFIITGAFGVILHVIKTDGLRGEWDRLKAAVDAHIKNYATEYRKRLEAEQAHTDLADKHNVLLAKAYIRDGARFVRVVK